jgi:hypothetical protein
VHCDIGIICPVKSERSFIADRTFIFCRNHGDYLVNDLFGTSLTETQFLKRDLRNKALLAFEYVGRLVLLASTPRTLRQSFTFFSDEPRRVNVAPMMKVAGFRRLRCGGQLTPGGQRGRWLSSPSKGSSWKTVCTGMDSRSELSAMAASRGFRQRRRRQSLRTATLSARKAKTPFR